MELGLRIPGPYHALLTGRVRSMNFQDLCKLWFLTLGSLEDICGSSINSDEFQCVCTFSPGGNRAFKRLQITHTAPNKNKAQNFYAK